MKRTDVCGCWECQFKDLRDKYNKLVKKPKLNSEEINCINFLMDFWETHHRSSCKNEKVFERFRKLRGK